MSVSRSQYINAACTMKPARRKPAAAPNQWGVYYFLCGCAWVVTLLAFVVVILSGATLP